MNRFLSYVIITFVSVFALTLLMGCGKDPAATPSTAAPSSSELTSPQVIAAPVKPLEKPPTLPPMPVFDKPIKRGTKINPDVLRKFVLSENISVLESLNNVYKAKEEITLARTRLMPSLNISAILNSAGMFGMGGIGFLFPFLAPSNWAHLDITKHQLAASGYAYYLVELNDFSAAYAIYLSMLADQEIYQHLQVHYANIEQIRQFVEQAYKQGKVSEVNVRQAAAQSDLAHSQVTAQKNSIEGSRASLRKMLGFDLAREFYLEETHLGALALEDRSPMEILKLVFDRSPEVRQIDSLIDAARVGADAAPFGFLGGASGNLSLEGGTGAFSAGGSIELNFGIFPEIRLSKINLESFQLRRREIILEQARVIETTLNSLANAKSELADITSAETNANRAYELTQAKFSENKASLTDLIDASEVVIGAGLSKVSARLKVDTQRLNLERILIAKEFAAIPNCRLDKNLVHNKPFAWLENLFDPGANQASVDQLCRSRDRQR